MRSHKVFISLACLLLSGMIAHGSVATDLSDLSWMSGHWSGVQDGIEMEESWMPPKGGTMLGLHRDIKNGRTVSFEFFRIQAEAEGITYWASPRGKPATPFRLIESSSHRVVFENAKHDFPQRIIYWLDDDKLHARTEGTVNGKLEAEEWAWQRSPKK